MLLQKQRELHNLSRRTGKKKKKSRSERNVAYIFEYYAKRADIRSSRKQDKARFLNVPAMFSLIDDPDSALRTIEQLVAFGRNKKTETIHILQNECKHIDHGAASVLNVLALAADTDHRLELRGKLPEDPNAKAIVIATGLPKVFNVPMPTPTNFLTFELRRGAKKAVKATMSSQQENISTEIVTYLNKCLGNYNYALTDESAGWLSGLVGEVLGNAEDHGGRGDWWIAGYLRSLPNNSYGDCHITILNFGETVCETMQKLDKDCDLSNQIHKLISTYKEDGRLNKPWTEENLWTLYALQEGISRFNTKDYRRGHGLPDMIEFFQNLGANHTANEDPRMALISGRTQIIFDNRYKISRRESLGGNRRVIAFNEQNDLKVAPDVKSVKKISHFFPGTILTMDFFIDPVNLERLNETIWKQ